ncbi:hypothetical protein ACQ4WX_49050 [Streptomyces lasalocidi]
MLDSPVAYQSRFCASRERVPVDRDGRLSEIGFQNPPPVVERKTPPLAPPAYTYPWSSAAMPVIRPVTSPAPPLELEFTSR